MYKPHVAQKRQNYMKRAKKISLDDNSKASIYKHVQSSDYKHESKLSFMEEPKSTIALAINRTWVNC